MEEVFFIIVKGFVLLALPFCIFVLLFIVHEIWEMRNTPSYGDIIFKLLDIYTGPIKEGKMSEVNKEIPGYIQRMCVESNELGTKIEKLNNFIESENSKNLSIEDRLDLSLQLNAMEEYGLILKRRLDRAFKREGL